MPDKGSGRKDSMLYGTLLLTGSSVAIRGVQMVFLVYISSVLGAAGLGKLHLILTVGSFAAILGSGGVRIAATCLSAEEAGRGASSSVRAAVRCCFLYGISLSILVSTALLFLSVPVSARWIGDPEAAHCVRMLAASLPIGCASSVLAGFFTASGRIRELAAIELAEQILSLCIVVFLIHAEIADPVACVVCGTAFSSLAGLSVLMIQYSKYMCRIPSAPLLPMMKRLLQFAMPLGFNDILRSGLRTGEHLLIPKGLRKSGASGEEAAASYGVIGGMVFPVISFPCIILNAVSDLLIPELARCRALNRSERIRSLTEKCLRFSAIFSISFAGACLLIGEELGALLFHNPEAGSYIRIYSPLIPILYMDVITDGILKGLSQQLYTARYNTVTSLLDLFLIWALLPPLGLRGFLIAFTVSHALNFYLSLRRLVIATGYVPNLLPVGISVVCCGASLLLTCCFSLVLCKAVIPLKITTFFSLYILFSRLLGVLTDSDILWLKELIHQKQKARSV